MTSDDGDRQQAGESGGLSGVAKAGVAVTAVAATAVGAKKLISSWRERRAGRTDDGEETPAARDADEAKRLVHRRDERRGDAGDRAAEGAAEEDLSTALERAAFQAAVGAASAVVDRLGGESGESRGDDGDDRTDRAD